MRRWGILVAVLCLALAFCAFAQNHQESQGSALEGFRGSAWGITMDAAKLAEKAEFIKEQTGEASGLKIFLYKGTAAGIDCFIGYYFAGGFLVEGRFVLLTNHHNKNLFIDDFKSIDASLVEKYGIATSSDSYWRNPLYKDDLPEWGMAISLGHLFYKTTWRFPGTQIQHVLYGDNFKINHAVDFKSTDPALMKLTEEARKNASKAIW
jgi:hypothetical protein